MKILFLADAVFEDLPGGSRVVARELARGLVQRGHEVTFLVRRKKAGGPDETHLDGVHVVRFEATGNPVHYLRVAKETCERLCAENAFDIVHTHFAYSALGPLTMVPKTVPQVRTFHGPWDEEGWLEDIGSSPGVLGRAKALIKKAIRRRIEVANLRRSDRILTLSDCFRRKVIEHYGIPADRVQTIPGGTDITRFVPVADKTAVRSVLGLPTDRFILFSVRRLAPRMGLNSLIKSMPAVVARHPQALLILGGEGPEAQRLTTLIASLGLTEHVRLVGFIPEEQLAAYFQASDLFVLPTVALEGFGLVTTEALSCGIPVLGTHIGATPEILAQLDARLIIPGTSPEAIAAAVLRFLEEDWAKELTPDRLRRFVLERYQWDRHVEAVESVYKKLMEASAGFEARTLAHQADH